MKVVVETPVALTPEARGLIEKAEAALRPEAMPRRRAFRNMVASVTRPPVLNEAQGRGQRPRPAGQVAMSAEPSVQQPRAGSRVVAAPAAVPADAVSPPRPPARLYVNRVSLFPLQAGLSFSLPLMAILTFHEFGHYIAARLHGVRASLPYFIPMPPPFFLFGTMGAVISQSGTTDRKKLIDIGAAGPLAGLVVAVPVLIYGLQQSRGDGHPGGWVCRREIPSCTWG